MKLEARKCKTIKPSKNPKTPKASLSGRPRLVLPHLVMTLAASQKQSRILELGTGAGYSTSWLLEGMDESSKLYSVEMNEACAEIAKEILGNDPRLHLITGDGENYIKEHLNDKFDFIFADTWPGKFYFVEEVLNMVKPGGFYIIDDLNPQPNWSEGHGDKVVELIAYLESREDFFLSKLNWSTGLIIMTKKNMI